MSGKYSDDAGLNFHDLMADPMIRLIMQADCIDERELREMLERTSADIKNQRQSAYDDPAKDLSSASETPALRRGVGIMLVNDQGQVFVGQRIDVTVDAWQMPQGGVEDGEGPRAAALRELREEIGTSNADVVVATESWLHYELPSELLERLPEGTWRGQKQKWFLMRFRGTDAEINVATEHPEFSKWKWISPEHLLDLIVPFKRELYRDVLLEFSSYLPERDSPQSVAR
jgi:putative (di)nucleoside polyphosphate hydrolase